MRLIRAILILLMCLALCMFACRGNKTSQPSTILSIELGYDPTPPDADERARQAAATIPFFDPNDQLILRATDNKTTIISTTLPFDDNAAYEIFKSIGTRVVPVTDLATYFEAVAAAAQNYSCPTIILLYTDGLDDGKCVATTARIEAAARRLAANPRVRAVFLIGTVRDTRPDWKGLPEMLAGLNDGQEKRLFVQPQAGMNPDVIAEQMDTIRMTLSVAPQPR